MRIIDNFDDGFLAASWSLVDEFGTGGGAFAESGGKLNFSRAINQGSGRFLRLERTDIRFTGDLQIATDFSGYVPNSNAIEGPCVTTGGTDPAAGLGMGIISSTGFKMVAYRYTGDPDIELNHSVLATSSALAGDPTSGYMEITRSGSDFIFKYDVAGSLVTLHTETEVISGALLPAYRTRISAADSAEAISYDNFRASIPSKVPGIFASALAGSVWIDD